MKVVVIGRNGQLAWELQRSVPTGFEIAVLGSGDLDITQAEAVATRIQHIQPQLVINSAAYTAVDKAEGDAINAYRINETGARNLALACRDCGARLLHVSTDFVFDGEHNTPYQNTDRPNPVGVYGASKYAGEQQVLQFLPDNALVVRTSWVYSVHGNNFVKTILRLLKEKPQLGVVTDQIGTPTWAKNLAAWLWRVAAKPELKGIYHWSDAGVASWYDFAVAIQELALQKGLLAASIPVNAIPSDAYPTPARRPKYSVLDKRSAEEASGLRAAHWRQQLSLMMDELK